MKRNLAKLRIKIKHLAAEPAIIRHEMRKALKERDYYSYQSFYSHNKFTVRPEARATQLAYAFLRGKKYSDVEPGQPLIDEVKEWPNCKMMTSFARMVDVYGDDLTEFFTEGQLKDIRTAPFDKRRDLRREYIRKYIYSSWINII